MYFCTYFDYNYIHKGSVCLYTLFKNNRNSLIFVVCLDDNTYLKLTKLKNYYNTIPIHLSEIEKEFPDFLEIKNTRLLKEYYATMSPILPLFIFKKYSYVDKLFYTDADIAFWSDQNEILDIFENKSLMVTDHGFEPPRLKIRFNVGILGYKNDDNCKEFLEWWKSKCIEWCKWETTPDGKCADQGYLNILHDNPNKFKNTLSCPHPGVNLGPWNISKHKITKNDNKIIIDNKYNLICYHYHEFRLLNNSYYPTGWKHSNSDREIVYDPYFKLIKKSVEGNLIK